MHGSPIHFNNVPKMVSVFPKVEHEHKHLPTLCAAFRIHYQMKEQGVQDHFQHKLTVFGPSNEDSKAWYARPC